MPAKVAAPQKEKGKKMETILLAIITLLLVVTVFLLWLGRDQTPNFSIGIEAEDWLSQVKEAMAEHVEVAAVIELVRQLDESNADLESLREYPGLVVSATLVHRADIIGKMIQYNQEEAKKRESLSHFEANNLLQRASELQKQLEALPVMVKRL